MQKRITTQLACFAFLMVGCASLVARTCQASKSVRAYQANDIGQEWINLVWVEIPTSESQGTFPGRLFIASAHPLGAIVPSMIDLPCIVSSPESAVDLAPAPVEIEFKEAGNLQTSYSWRSCSRCGECYMVWDYHLTLQGHRGENFLLADIVLTETFHSSSMKILSLRLPEVTQACTEPHMSCRAGGECNEIRFEPRP